MAIIELHMPNPTENTNPQITVLGVGGAGGNVINNMIAAGLGDVQFVVANTDKQALAASKAERCIQLGTSLTEGLGAGSDPEVGEAAAEEAVDEIRAALAGSHMLFIAAGMGGGTGTGAAYVIAREARDMDILTIAVVTKPFQFEGSIRLRNADAGIAELRKYADTLLVIPNENLFRVATDKTTFADAFVMADQVMYSGIISITDLIVKEGLINLDLADVRTVLGGMGRAMLGMGEAAGEQRATVAAEEAIVNPLLDDVTLKGAKSLLLCITGGRDMTLWEVEEAASRVCQEVDTNANIIVGATFDEGLGDRIRVSIVASGMPRLAVEMPARHIEGPMWTPRAQRDPDGVAAGDGFGRRLTEAIGDGESPPRGRTGQRGRARERRAPGELEAKKDGSSKLPKQPGAARPRKAPASRKTPPPLSQMTARAAELPAEVEDLDSKRRMRRLPLDEAPVLPPRWPDRPAPQSERVLEEPLIPPQPAVTLRHEPQPLPRKAGFLERLGFGRVRREA